MGFFTPYIYISKKSGQKFWIHGKPRGRMVLYYFSKDPIGGLNGLPKGFEVAENPVTGMPFVKKKSGGFFGGIVGKPKVKQEGSQENKDESPPESK